MQSLEGKSCGFCSEQRVKPREGVKRRMTGLSESFKGRLWLPGRGVESDMGRETRTVVSGSQQMRPLWRQ